MEISKILSIITVVKDDYDGLIMTALSVQRMRNQSELEYIIWINNQSTYSTEQFNYINTLADKVYFEEDSGIFDAMNKSLNFSSSKFILFLNAKDYFLEDLDISEISEPSMINVFYRNYFGKLRFIIPNKSLKFGIPHCHQGLILPREGYYFDPRFKFGADYNSIINLKLNWPLKFLSMGIVKYDNTGISTVNRRLSDLNTLTIIFENFGIIFDIFDKF